MLASVGIGYRLKDTVIGELIVLVPEVDKFGDPLNDGECVRSIILACPTVMRAAELKKRIGGSMKITYKKIHVLYRGLVLKDDDVCYTKIMYLSTFISYHVKKNIVLIIFNFILV